MEQAVILAAGEGQRLRPFTVTRPKVMLSIAGKPILQYAIEALAQNGIRRIVLVVGYRREQIYNHFGNGEQLGVELIYVTQERQLGTAHALAQARDSVKGGFLVLAGDNLIDGGTIAELAVTNSPAMLVKRVDDPARYGVVTVEGGFVRRITEKPGQADGETVNTSTYAFTREVFDFIGAELDIPEVVNKMLAEGRRIKALDTRGTWLDAVYPWDIVRLSSTILARTQAKLGGTIEAAVAIRGPVSIGNNTVIRSHSYIAGPVAIGEGCEIGPNVCILPATCIGDNVSIGPFTTIENSVIADDVTIGPTSIIEDSVIDTGCVIRGHLTACSGDAGVEVDTEYHRVHVGAMIGIGCSLGSSVVAEPGLILGNYCEVKPMKIVSGRVPDRAIVH